jgi:hypothetical protein
MLEGETIEEFEDRVLNKRAAHLNTILKSKLAVLPELKLSNMTRYIIIGVFLLEKLYPNYN